MSETGGFHSCSWCGARVHESRLTCPRCGRDLTSGEPLAVVPAVTRSVLFRDLLIFEIKLFLDGMGDLIMSQVALVAFAIDFILGGPRPGRVFYRVLKAAERWDLWLNLYVPAKDAEVGPGGLLGSAGSADSLLLKLQELAAKREGGARDRQPPAKRQPPEGSQGADRDRL